MGGREHQVYLICREMVSQAAEDEGNSFSLDHLLVDDEGVPILVEVKRSTDTRIRREVVAQMMDYACRASSWSIDSLKELFRQTTIWQTRSSCSLMMLSGARSKAI